MQEGLGFPSLGVFPEKRRSWVRGHELSLPRAGRIPVWRREEHFYGGVLPSSSQGEAGKLVHSNLKAGVLGSPSSFLQVGALGEACGGLWLLFFFQLEGV